MTSGADAVTQPGWSDFWSAQAGRSDPVSTLAAQHGFVLNADEMRRLAISRAMTRTRCGRQEWTSAGHGHVAPLRAPTMRHAHALTAAAAARRRPDDAISGRSAGVLYALPLVRDPEQPRLTLRVESLGRGRSTARCFTGWLAEDELTAWYGVPVASPARTLIDLARHDRFDGIMAVDVALHLGLVSFPDLAVAIERAAGWPGVKQAREVLLLGDPRSESPLESVTRLRLHDDGFPPPEPQFWIGSHRVDFCWPDLRLVLEVDGRVKYDRRDGDVDPLWLEKRRETAVRRDGYRVERVIASDVFGGWRATSAYLRRYFPLTRPAVV